MPLTGARVRAFVLLDPTKCLRGRAERGLLAHDSADFLKSVLVNVLVLTCLRNIITLEEDFHFDLGRLLRSASPILAYKFHV